MDHARAIAVWILACCLLAGCGGGSGDGSGTPPDTEGVTVTSVSPGSGSLDGGNRVSVRGTGFSTTIVSVTFGGRPASEVSTSGDTTIDLTVPPGRAPGPVDVVVTTSTDTGTLYDGYTYDTPPLVLAVVPPAGWPGVTVSIVGLHFARSGPGRTEVFFGAHASPLPQVVNDTLIFATVPPGVGGLVDVTVVGDNGTGVLESGFLSFQGAAAEQASSSKGGGDDLEDGPLAR